MESKAVTVYYQTEQTKQLQKIEQKELVEIRHNFVNAEVNFLQYPIGTLDKFFKGNSITFKDTLEYEGGKVERIWQVSGNAEFGFPGPTAVELDLAITKLISEKTPTGEPVRKWYKTSYEELAKYMGLTKTGPLFDYIKKDLYKLLGVLIVSKRTFKRIDQEQKWGELAFHKYDAVALKGESIPDQVDEEERKKSKDGKAEQVYIVLSDIYLENLNAHYTKKINYELIKQLHGAKAKRIYSLLSYQFSNHMKPDPDGKECINYNYMELCGRMPMKVLQTRWQARQQLKKHLDQLVKQGYLEKYIFEFDGQPARWFIRFYPGKLARQELAFGEQLSLWNTSAFKQKQLESEIEAEEQNKQQLTMKSEAKKKEEENKRAEIRHQQYLTKFQALPTEEQERLRQQARENLLARGRKKEFILSLDIEYEIVEILARLENSTVGASPQDNRAPERKDSASQAPAGPES